MPLVGLLTLTKSPGARAHYDYRRARGDTHNAALRNLANKLLGRLCRQVRDRSVSNNWDQKRTGRLRVGILTVARRAPLSEPDAHCLAFRRPQKAGLVCEHHCLDAVAEIADDSRTDWAGFTVNPVNVCTAASRALRVPADRTAACPGLRRSGPVRRQPPGSTNSTSH
jgi:hypothetical protein